MHEFVDAHTLTLQVEHFSGFTLSLYVGVVRCVNSALLHIINKSLTSSTISAETSWWAVLLLLQRIDVSMLLSTWPLPHTSIACRMLERGVGVMFAPRLELHVRYTLQV